MSSVSHMEEELAGLATRLGNLEKDYVPAAGSAPIEGLQMQITELASVVRDLRRIVHQHTGLIEQLAVNTDLEEVADEEVAA